MSAIQNGARTYFKALQKSVITQLQDAIGKVEKDDSAEEIEQQIQRILDDLDLSGDDVQEFADLLREELRALFADGAAQAAQQIGAKLSTDAFSQVSASSIEFAKERAAEMVGMKWVDEKLVPNPNAQWQIEDATREMLRSDVRDAITEGWSNDKLADKLSENYGFSDERAEMIARTETAMADVKGSLDGYRAAGVKSKAWIVGADCCDACQELDGVEVGIDEQFPNDGGDGPPLHPMCRCDVLPVIEDDNISED